jgi:sugar lactone lactonase YvrE
VGAPEYAIDPRGRQVIAGTTFQGDLTLRRVFNGGVAGAVIEREEFRNFLIDGFALDSDGAVYVATGAGGREPADTREMLCQLPETGSARCFTLGEIQSRERSSILIDNLAVPEPGVVYIRTDETLRRYELPVR